MSTKGSILLGDEQDPPVKKQDLAYDACDDSIKRDRELPAIFSRLQSGCTGHYRQYIYCQLSGVHVGPVNFQQFIIEA